LPENVCEKLAVNSSAPSLSNEEQDGDLSRQSKKKKKRRSGSITRKFVACYFHIYRYPFGYNSSYINRNLKTWQKALKKCTRITHLVYLMLPSVDQTM
jgi:hypothetical protein